MSNNIKKFLDPAGTSHLWNQITAELNKKAALADLAAIATSGAANDIDIVDTGNYYNATTVEGALQEIADSMQTTGAVTVSETAGTGNVLKIYTLTQRGNTIGTITIPRDLVATSGEIVNSDGTNDGIFLKLTIANSNPIYIDVASLVEYNNFADSAEIAFTDANHQISGTLKTGSIAKSKLASSVQTSLEKADTALQQADITEGSTDGAISVSGTDVAVHGLGSAAYMDASTFDNALAGKVDDVQIGGTSILDNGVANIPYASQNRFGVIKVGRGLATTVDNKVYVYKASTDAIKGGSNIYDVIVPYNQHLSVFYGLAVAAGANAATPTSQVGVYSDEAKQAIQNMLGVTDLISAKELPTATAAHAVNSLFMMNGKLCRTTTAIVVGDAVEIGVNCEVVKASEVFVKNTDYATSDNYGIVKIGNGLTISTSTGKLQIDSASVGTIKSGGNNTAPIVPSHQHEAVFYGLSKIAGADLANETVTLGTYPETSKTAIRSLIDAAAVSDLINLRAQIAPQYEELSFPVYEGQHCFYNNRLYLAKTTINTNEEWNAEHWRQQPIDNIITSMYGNLNVYARVLSTKYTKPAQGIPASDLAETYLTQETDPTVPAWAKSSTKPTYTAAEVGAPTVQEMNTAIGAAIGNINSFDMAVVQTLPSQDISTHTIYLVPKTGDTNDVYDEYVYINNAWEMVGNTQIDLSNYVQKTDYATADTAGIIKVEASTCGLRMSDDGEYLRIVGASINQIKLGTDGYRPVTPGTQHRSVFYGLAKAAGDTTQSQSNNAVGTYTTEAQTAILNMFGLQLATDTEIQNIINGGVGA